MHKTHGGEDTGGNELKFIAAAIIFDDAFSKAGAGERVSMQKTNCHHRSRSRSPKLTILQPGSGYKIPLDGVPKAVEVEELNNFRQLQFTHL